jgi:DNA-binding NarL/FixJ family response regulator
MLLHIFAIFLITRGIESSCYIKLYPSKLDYVYNPVKSPDSLQMTANSFSESSDECLAAGMDSYISKPVNFQNIKQCLQLYLPSQ